MGICVGTGRIIYRINENVMGAIELRTVPTIKTYLTDNDGNETYIMYIPGESAEIKVISRPDYKIPNFYFSEGFKPDTFKTPDEYTSFVDKIYFLCLIVLEKAVLENVRNHTYSIKELEKEFIERENEVTEAAQSIRMA